MRPYHPRPRLSPDWDWAIPVAAMVMAAIWLAWMIPAACRAQVYQDYSNTKINNDTGGALGLINITGSDHTQVATLYITGRHAWFGENQTLIKGSGYIQSVPNKHFRVVLSFNQRKAGQTDDHFNEVRLLLDRIEWDD